MDMSSLMVSYYTGLVGFIGFIYSLYKINYYQKDNDERFKKNIEIMKKNNEEKIKLIEEKMKLNQEKIKLNEEKMKMLKEKEAPKVTTVERELEKMRKINSGLMELCYDKRHDFPQEADYLEITNNHMIIHNAIGKILDA